MEKRFVKSKPNTIAPDIIDAIQGRRKPLFEAGSVVATPAVLRHLAANNVLPAAFLSYHLHGEWGQVSPEDAAANDRAVKDGGRILSVFGLASEKIWIITEAVGDDGHRASTCMLFPSEY
jgi:hypothetical protein